jgi:hypothetical protein
MSGNFFFESIETAREENSKEPFEDTVAVNRSFIVIPLTLTPFQVATKTPNFANAWQNLPPS